MMETMTDTIETAVGVSGTAEAVGTVVEPLPTPTQIAGEVAKRLLTRRRDAVTQWQSLEVEIAAAGMDITTFAARLQVTESAVRQWLSGEFAPTLARFQEIVDTLSFDAPRDSEAWDGISRRLIKDVPRGKRIERRRAAAQSAA